MTSHRTVLIRYFGVNVIIAPLTGTDYFFCKNTFMLFLESKRLETKLLALECQPPGHSYSKHIIVNFVGIYLIHCSN